MKKLLVVSICLLLASPALAQVWTEVGDAPDMPPGQTTGPAGPLTAITGGIGTTTDVDLYEVHILSSSWSASTVGTAGSLSDTQLWLFGLDGTPLVFNDDGGYAGAGLRSAIGPAALTPLDPDDPPIWPPVPSKVLLGISSYDRDADNGAGIGGALFDDTPYGQQRGPNPGVGILGGWHGAGSIGTYTINLVGIGGVPEPGTLLLLGLGLIGLLRRR